MVEGRRRGGGIEEWWSRGCKKSQKTKKSYLCKGVLKDGISRYNYLDVLWEAVGLQVQR